MGLATPEDLAHLRKSALTINSILTDFFAKCGLKLVDFKIEFGRLVSDPTSSFSQTRSARTAAACGISRPARKWTRTDSAATSAG